MQGGCQISQKETEICVRKSTTHEDSAYVVRKTLLQYVLAYSSTQFDTITIDHDIHDVILPRSPWFPCEVSSWFDREIMGDPQETCFKRINTKLNQLRLTLPDLPPVPLDVAQEPQGPQGPQVAQAPMNAAPWRSEKSLAGPWGKPMGKWLENVGKFGQLLRKLEKMIGNK